VVDLATMLGLAQATVSGHLACLRDCSLVNWPLVGRQSYYRLAVDELEALLRAAEQVLARTGDAVELCPNYGIPATTPAAAARRPPGRRSLMRSSSRLWVVGLEWLAGVQDRPQHVDAPSGQGVRA
jgi:hypothetical protein